MNVSQQEFSGKKSTTILTRTNTPTHKKGHFRIFIERATAISPNCEKSISAFDLLRLALTFKKHLILFFKKRSLTKKVLM